MKEPTEDEKLYGASRGGGKDPSTDIRRKIIAKDVQKLKAKIIPKGCVATIYGVNVSEQDADTMILAAYYMGKQEQLNAFKSWIYPIVFITKKGNIAARRKK